MPLGLGSNLSKTGLTTPGIVTDNLVLKHKYDAGSVIPCSDGAAYFGADTTSYIALSSQTLSVHDTACSITFWIYRNSSSAYDVVLGQQDNSSHNWILFGNDTTDIYFEGENNNYAKTEAGSSNRNEWIHYAITTNGSGSAQFYRNGVSLTMSDTSIGTDFVFDAIGAGDTGGSTTNMDGYICNVGVWNGTALTQPQIKSIMNKNYAGLTSSEKTNLVSWWNLSADANDSHGSNNGTLS